MQEIYSLPTHQFLIKKINIEDFSEIKKNIVNQQYRNNIGNKISFNLSVLNDPDFKKLKDYIELEASEFLGKVYFPNTLNNFKYNGLQVTKSWVNVSDKGQHHHLHYHAFSVLSGVIFLTNCKDNNNLTFQFSKQEIPYLGIPSIKNEYSLKEIVKNGEELEDCILLFNSSTFHNVKPVDQEDTRITLSFNTWWLEEVGVTPIGSLRFKRM